MAPAVELDERIARACGYLLDHALVEGGRFSATGTPGGTVDCLQGNLCWALVELGCRDPRLIPAYDWMARSVTGEGIAPASDRQAAPRYNSLKCGPVFACGPNGKQSCAWGAVKVLLAFAQLAGRAAHASDRAGHPPGRGLSLQHRSGPGRLPDRPAASRAATGGNSAFPCSTSPTCSRLVEALARLGYGTDPRLAAALSVIREKQDAQGRWPLEYDYNGKTWLDLWPKKAPNKWVTLRALRTLAAL